VRLPVNQRQEALEWRRQQLALMKAKGTSGNGGAGVTAHVKADTWLIQPLALRSKRGGGVGGWLRVAGI
jgi:hypothetical protein